MEDIDLKAFVDQFGCELESVRNPPNDIISKDPVDNDPVGKDPVDNNTTNKHPILVRGPKSVQNTKTLQADKVIKTKDQQRNSLFQSR
jgi:hypothetical protein